MFFFLLASHFLYSCFSVFHFTCHFSIFIVSLFFFLFLIAVLFFCLFYLLLLCFSQFAFRFSCILNNVLIICLPHASLAHYLCSSCLSFVWFLLSPTDCLRCLQKTRNRGIYAWLYSWLYMIVHRSCIISYICIYIIYILCLVRSFVCRSFSIRFTWLLEYFF